MLNLILVLLVLMWLVAALYPDGPYAVLALGGVQGSAKSLTCRMLRRLVDPNMADLRAPPRNEDNLLVAAQATIDVASRARLYAQVQDRVAEDAPWVPIAHSEVVVARRRDVHGLSFTPSSMLTFRDVMVMH